MTVQDNTTSYAASEYDSHVGQTIPYYSAFHEEVFHFIRAVAGDPEQWLDTGCGTGTMVRKALDCFPRTRFTLADPSEAMLEQARLKFDSSRNARVRILPAAAGSAELSPAYDAHFNVVTAIQCHHYLKRNERRDAVEACCHMLKPGGLFLAFENIRPSSDIGVEFGKRYWLAYQIRNGKSEEEARGPIERFDWNYFPITVAEHLELLREAGFADAGLLWFSYMQAGFWAVRSKEHMKAQVAEGAGQ